jgi:hypothetical protein
MTIDNECEGYARDCVRRAGLVKDQHPQDQLLDMAREWMAAATRVQPKPLGDGILIKKAPTESGLQVRSHLPEGNPARIAGAGRAKLRLHGFAGSVTRSFGRSTNRLGAACSQRAGGSVGRASESERKRQDSERFVPIAGWATS